MTPPRRGGSGPDLRLGRTIVAGVGAQVRAGSSRWIAPADVVDVFVYVVVLNLAAEWFPAVIAESFTMSLVTAVVLKLVLEIVVATKNRLKSRFRAANTVVGKLVSGLLLWVTLVGSKFVVLELEALLFGEHISLGGFVPVTLLIIVMLLARAGVRRLLAVPDDAS